MTRHDPLRSFQAEFPGEAHPPMPLMFRAMLTLLDFTLVPLMECTFFTLPALCDLVREYVLSFLTLDYALGQALPALYERLAMPWLAYLQPEQFLFALARWPEDGLTACLHAFADCYTLDFLAALILDEALARHDLDWMGRLNLPHFFQYATLTHLTALAHCASLRWLVLLAVVWHWPALTLRFHNSPFCCFCRSVWPQIRSAALTASGMLLLIERLMNISFNLLFYFFILFSDLLDHFMFAADCLQQLHL